VLLNALLILLRKASLSLQAILHISSWERIQLTRLGLDVE
jgi:hypothetical protein